MAATTLTVNVGYDQQVALVQQGLAQQNLGHLRVARWKATLDGAGTIAAEKVIKLPAGSIVIYPMLCGVVIADAAASTTFDMGYAAYTDEDGDAQVAAGDVIFDGLATDSGPTESLGVVGTNALGAPLAINTRDGLDITVTMAGGDADSADVWEGWIVFSGGSPN